MRIAKLMHLFWDKGPLNSFQFCLKQLKQQFLNNERICKSMVFGVKRAPAVVAKGAR